MLNECIPVCGSGAPRGSLAQAREALPLQSALFSDSPVPPQDPAQSTLGADAKPGQPSDWSEEDIVLLHWRLLQELRHLEDPAAPLQEKIDTLNWVFTDPDKDAAPFSFVSCLRVVGCSPLSPSAYFGLVDPEAIRDWIRARVASWMQASLERYPEWVREQIRANAQRVVRELERNPQWINEQIRRHAARGQLFA